MGASLSCWDYPEVSQHGRQPAAQTHTARPNFKAKGNRKQRPRRRVVNHTSTPLHVAAEAGNVPVLKSLVERCVLSALSGLLNKVNEQGLTALALAAKSKQPEAVAFLLSKGADPWAVDGRGARNVLHYACMQGSPETIKAVMDNLSPSCDKQKYVNTATAARMTPLHFAVVSRSLEAVQVLLSYEPEMEGLGMPGSRTSEPGQQYVTPLEMAQANGNSDMVLKLLKHYVLRQTAGQPGQDPSHCRSSSPSLAAVSCGAQQQQQQGFQVPSLAKLAGRVHKQVLLRQLTARMHAAGSARPRGVMDTCGALDDSASSLDSGTGIGSTTNLTGSGRHGRYSLGDTTDVDASSRLQLSQLDSCVKIGDGSGNEDGMTDGASCWSCPVCLDGTVNVQLRPCVHRLCSNCAVQMVTWQINSKPVACPVCQEPVAKLA